MGHTHWDEAAYANRSSARALGTRAAMAYTADIAQGRAEAKVHDMMNPKGVRLRESRDSEAHPESLPIAVFFDVTGSMGSVPRQLQQRLQSLMTLLTTNGYAAHPQVLFGAVGDMVSDDGPLQVGQFEAGLEMDDDLDRIWVEGGGGGGYTESYEAAHYFVARHVATDAWDRRRHRGFLFTIGDEQPYPTVRARSVSHFVGDALPGDVPTAALVEELRERWHVFHLHVMGLSKSGTTLPVWQQLLGEGCVVQMRDPANAAELIAATVGLVEGAVTLAQVRDHLQQVGVDAGALDSITTSLEAVAERAINLRRETPTTA